MHVIWDILCLQLTVPGSCGQIGLHARRRVGEGNADEIGRAKNPNMVEKTAWDQLSRQKLVILSLVRVRNEIKTQSTFYKKRLSENRACIRSHVHDFLRDVIIHSCPNFKGGLVRPPLTGRVCMTLNINWNQLINNHHENVSLQTCQVLQYRISLSNSS